MKACTKHIEGATQLLRLRGAGQFQTKTGMRLFQHFRTYAVSNRRCVADSVLTREDHKLPL